MRSVSKVVDTTPIHMSHAGVTLHRVIGTLDIDGHGTAHSVADVDPFLLLDESRVEGNVSSSFKKHPHTGLTAVTYLLEGTAHAWDNINGATTDLNRAGGVYCVSAGRGVVHGEAPIEGMRKVRLLQLWLNPGIYELPLPQANYQLFQPDELPVYQDDKVWAKVIIGEGFHLASPVVSHWPIQYLHIKLATQQSFTFEMPDPAFQGFIYILNGQGKFGSNEALGKEQQCLVLGTEPSTAIQISNTDSNPLEFVLATGKPHHKPFFKLLGHGGAIVADTALRARSWMKAYEADPEHFGVE